MEDRNKSQQLGYVVLGILVILFIMKKRKAEAAEVPLITQWRELSPTEKEEFWNTLSLTEKEEFWNTLSPTEKNEIWNILSPTEKNEIWNILSPTEKIIYWMGGELPQRPIEDLLCSEWYETIYRKKSIFSGLGGICKCRV